jgi:hypothetical protein
MRLFPALILTLASLAPVLATAQGRGGTEPQFAKPEVIDPAEGTRILESFRNARTEGDYEFSIQLVSRTRDGRETELFGTMWGTWDDEGAPLIRVDLARPGEATLHIISLGGDDGTILRAEGDAPAQAMSDAGKFAPLAEGATLTPFDIQMPFVRWTDYTSEGTKKIIGRNAHYFRLRPPAGQDCQNIASVRVAIDANFMILLSAEELDASGSTLKTFRINDFAKKDGQWIIKELDLVDARNKNRTRFRVLDATLGLNLPRALFAPGADGTIKPVKTDPNTQVGN